VDVPSPVVLEACHSEANHIRNTLCLPASLFDRIDTLPIHSL
jgi:hypothetical protein